MNILLVAVNSKYTHTSLAVRTLSRNAYDVPFVEFTINEKIDYIISEVYKKNPDIVCFSCYIWNIEFVKKIASSLKSINNNIRMVFGGPEVSYTPKEFLKECSYAECVICGEGEDIFRNLVENGFEYKNANGVVYRNGNDIIVNPLSEPVADLDKLIFPYTDEDLKENSGKLIYYESSRGCPFNCSYCISSTIHSLRFKSIDKVKEELSILIKHKPKTIKFVDRTFNADIKRSCELVKFMIENGKGVVFHFEIAAHMLNDEFINLICNSPKNMFRLEIGIQSTNPDTIKAINRVTDFKKLTDNISRIVSSGNSHIHLDLIAGLPYENLDSFKQSFNDVMSLKPDVVQLGFLKMLKGTEIRYNSEKFGYAFSVYPPYEILSNNFIKYEDIILLKEIDETVDKIYNSGAFKAFLNCFEKKFENYFDMYTAISWKLKEYGFFEMSISRNLIYKALSQMCGEDELFLDLLKFDYLTSNKNASTPEWSSVPYDVEIHKKRIEIIDKNRDGIFCEFSDMSVNEILKKVHFEIFKYNVLNGYKEEKTLIVFLKSGEVLGVIQKY